MPDAPPPLLRTPLYEAHRAAGAKLVPFAGWEMPVQYKGGVIAEVAAVRHGAGLFDVSHMGRLRVHGADAAAFLDHVTVNDVSKLSPGRAQYSLLCTDAGGVVDDIIVYHVGTNDFVVVVNASNRVKAVAWLETHRATFKHVTMDDDTLGTGLIAVQGPNAVSLLQTLSSADLTVLPRFGVSETAVADLPVMAARTGYTGEDGIELFCRARDAEDLWIALTNLGAVPCGLGARDTLRVEAALPLYGHEMDERVDPYQARLAWVVKNDKAADFVGKASLALLKTAPSHKLVGLVMETRAVPRDGYAVVSENDQPIGHVTSGTFSPTLGHGIALARVVGDAAATGTLVSVVIRDTKHAARIAPLPFHKAK